MTADRVPRRGQLAAAALVATVFCVPAAAALAVASVETANGRPLHERMLDGAPAARTVAAALVAAAPGSTPTGAAGALVTASPITASPITLSPITAGATPYTVEDPTSAARTAITFALAQIGLPYVWGGNGPAAGHAGFDCSGLTTAAYAAAGIRLPRTAHTQYYAGPRLPSGTPLQPGDLVFYGVPQRVHHVGLYLGDGVMVSAPTFGKPVRLAYYRWRGDDYLGATRPSAGPAIPPVSLQAFGTIPPRGGPVPTAFAAPPIPAGEAPPIATDPAAAAGPDPFAALPPAGTAAVAPEQQAVVEALPEPAPPEPSPPVPTPTSELPAPPPPTPAPGPGTTAPPVTGPPPVTPPPTGPPAPGPPPGTPPPAEPPPADPPPADPPTATATTAPPPTDTAPTTTDPPTPAS